MMKFEDEEENLREETLLRRQAVVQALEKERGSRVITLMHRREVWDEPEKSAADQGLTIEDTEFVLMQIRATPPGQSLDLVVHTPGGLALAAEMIATAVRLHPAKVTVMVPFYAMPGGTLIALAADEILLEPYSVLGPVDPQIAGWPAAALIHLVEKKPAELVSDQVLMLAEIACLSLASVQRFILWLLADRMPRAMAVLVAEFLTGGYLAHDTPIMLQTAQELGLPVTRPVPDSVYELFETCAFGLCRRPCLATYDPHPAPPTPPSQRH